MTLVSFKQVVAVAVAVVLSSSALAQSPAQIEMFKKLPRDQQEALAKQYGVDLGALQAQASGAPQAISNPVVVVPTKADNNNDINDKAAEAVVKDNDNEQLGDRAEARTSKVAALKLFGHDVFAGAPTTFAPATDIPVPLEYVIGPGDNIKLHMYGKVNSQISLMVDRDGMIMIPDVGPLHVAGASYQQLRDMIDREVSERALGINVITTLGELRSVRIFILGEANRPGSYTVSALSTITNALFVSGGISKSGSLRNIQLKRSGQTVVSFDLYDLLLKGDTSNDVRLQAGDVLFVPPVGKTVGVGGEVKRQAIFELKNEQTLSDVMALSGGFLPTAHLASAKVNRISNDGERTVLDVNLAQEAALNMPVSDGDVVNVYSILDDVENVITLAGHVYRPGNYAFQQGLKLTDVVKSIEELMPNVDLDYSLIRRENKATREIHFEQFALREVINGSANPQLQARDKIYVFANEGSRAGIAGDMARLRAQASQNQPPKIFTVTGAVEMAGTYPLMPNMSIEHALVAAHGVSFTADLDYALLKRVKEDRTIDVFTLNLNDSDDLSLAMAEEDQLYVFAKNQDRADVIEPLIAQLRAQVTKDVDDVIVSINGQVRFPGDYPYSVDMSLADLVAAAGGLTESAYLGDVEITSVTTDGRVSIEKTTKTVNLEAALGSNSVRLNAKDVLTVKRIPDWYENHYIELAGEFTFPGKYLIEEGETLADVIQRAGGFTRLAFPEGALYMRASVAQQQLKQLQLLEKKIVKEMTIIKAAKSMSSSSIPVSNASEENVGKLLSIIGDDTEGLGRIAIDLQTVMADSNNSFTLFNGDRLYVPRKPTTVSIIGEVQQNTTVAYRAGMDFEDYLDMAGGATGFADEGGAYIVRANGLIERPGTSLVRFGEEEIRPGDTIVVPLDVNLRDGLTLWTQITQLVYNSAVAVAAIATL